jgi:hypothetical protein
MDDRDFELSFQRECRSIFKWAHYRPHTIYHLNRFPLIGDWNAWQRLSDRLEIKLQGKIPTETNDEKAEHVLDVIFYQNQKLSNINMVETDMYTIVLVNPLSPMSADDEFSWKMTLKKINGSIVTIDYIKPIEKEASDGQNINNENNLTPSVKLGCSQSTSRTSVVHIVKDENIRSNEMDVLSVVFENINDALSKYQEQKVQNMMEQYGALIYNEDLQRNDPPDGYYLCNTKCLEQLNKLFSCVPHTFATTNILNSESSSDKYILLTVEVKLSFDSLQRRLDQNKYYIFEPALHPIRNLVIMNGGEATLTWLFLINLAHVDKTNRQTLIDQRIHERSDECARRLRESHTHIVYVPSFSSETFRQEPLTNDRLDLLCKLVAFEQKIQKYSKPIAGISGLKKCLLDHERDEKKRSYSKNMINLLDRFMKENPIRKQRSSINASILMQTEMHTERLFYFLEQLALSFLKEIYRNVSTANGGVKLPKQLIKHAQELREVKPVPIVEIPAVRTRLPSVRRGLFPTNIDIDDDVPLGQQPI